LKKALIIGCGYVGKVVARRWHQELSVTATTTSPERLPELQELADRAVVLHGNDGEALRSLLRDHALVLLTIGAPNATAYETTYLQTAKTLVSVLNETPAVQQVIYTSSYAVYGDRGGVWVDETTPPDPANRNGEILAETEQILLSAATVNRNICVFRLGGIYGPGRELVKIFRRAAGTIRPGTGEDMANWVHLDDIVGAIDFARQKSLTGIYNLVGTVPLTTGEVLQRVCQAHNLPPVSWDPTQPSLRPYNAKVSNYKLRQAGYQFIYPALVETE
jgi:nucleoside-diphosphate-sugar epimerase